MTARLSIIKFPASDTPPCFYNFVLTSSSLPHAPRVSLLPHFSTANFCVPFPSSHIIIHLPLCISYKKAVPNVPFSPNSRIFLIRQSLSFPSLPYKLEFVSFPLSNLFYYRYILFLKEKLKFSMFLAEKSRAASYLHKSRRTDKTKSFSAHSLSGCFSCAFSYRCFSARGGSLSLLDLRFLFLCFYFNLFIP